MLINSAKEIQRVASLTNLTPNQVCFCAMLLVKQKEGIKSATFHDMLRYMSNQNSLTVEDIEVCKEKGYVLEISNEEELVGVPTNYIISDKFEKKSNIKLYDYFFDELYAAYPIHLSNKINGNYVLAKSVSNADDLAKEYDRKIDSNLQNHVKILKLVKEANEKKLISVGLEKFIKNKLWESLEIQIESSNNIGNSPFEQNV